MICLWYSVVNSNMFHLTSIISVSLSSQVLFFPTNSIFTLLVAKIGMSVLIQTLVANWVLGDGSFTFSPSRRSSKSFQHISSLLHLKFCKTITPVWAAPAKAYLLFVGLVNTRKMIPIGFKFAGPTITTLRNLPFICSSKSLSISKHEGVYNVQLEHLPRALIPLHVAAINTTLRLVFP